MAKRNQKPDSRPGWRTFHPIAALLLIGLFVTLTDFHASPTDANAQPVKTGKPTIDAQAFMGHGNLAFVSSNSLYVLDGSTGKTSRVAVGGTLGDPKYSPDGRWLAFLRYPSTLSLTSAQLWIARGNGSDPHEWTKLVVGDLIGWSPHTDMFAVTTKSVFHISSGFAGSMPTSLQILSPNGQTHQLVALHPTTANPVNFESGLWSPDGSSVAASTTAPEIGGGATIISYPIDGSTPTTWFSITNKEILPGVCSGCGGGQTVPDLAGWWPKWGIGFWVYSSGMSRNNDGTPIELLESPGATPHIIATTLSDRATHAISSSTAGELAFVNVRDRDISSGADVEVCRVDSSPCLSIPAATVWPGHMPEPCTPSIQCVKSGMPNSGVSLDPSWSPSGDVLAYIKAPALQGDAWMTVTNWYSTHRLYLYSTTTGKSEMISQITGAANPEWSSDGRGLLYVADGALWFTAWPSVKPTKVSGPLFTSAGLNSYYFQVDWHDQFSWWSP